MKKERYFTLHSLKGQSRQLAQEIDDLRARHPQPLKPGESALLVLDMQDYFLDMTSHAFVPAAEAIIPGISNLIHDYSRHNLPVIFTRHLNTRTDAGMMSRWWKDLIRRENPLSRITATLDTTKGVIINKTQYDAFHQTELENMLRQQGVRQVIICGVMAHLCCETTARSAFMRGFEVFLAIDGTATYTQSLHRATLQNAAHGFAMPILLDEIIAALSEPNEN